MLLLFYIIILYHAANIIENEKHNNLCDRRDVTSLLYMYGFSRLHQPYAFICDPGRPGFGVLISSLFAILPFSYLLFLTFVK